MNFVNFLKYRRFLPTSSSLKNKVFEWVLVKKISCVLVMQQSILTFYYFFFYLINRKTFFPLHLFYEFLLNKQKYLKLAFKAVKQHFCFTLILIISLLCFDKIFCWQENLKHSTLTVEMSTFLTKTIKIFESFEKCLKLGNLELFSFFRQKTPKRMATYQIA